MAKIEIKTEGIKSKILLDGMDISNVVTKYEFVHEGGRLPQMQVTLLSTDMSISSTCSPTFLPDIQLFLRSLSENNSAAPAVAETVERE